jgi:hypothetical protein
VLNCCDLYAADVLDQSNTVAPGGTSINSLEVDSIFAAGQTVRVGISGILSRVDLGVFRQNDISSPLSVDIVRTQSGQPSFAAGDRLASITLDQSQIPLVTTSAQLYNPTNNVSVDFSGSGLSFNSGDLFGIVLRSNPEITHNYSWWVARPSVDTYPAGGSYSFQYFNNAVLPHGVPDTQFATYVQVAPEPSTFLLLGIGAISLLGRRKRSC